MLKKIAKSSGMVDTASIHRAVSLRTLSFWPTNPFWYTTAESPKVCTRHRTPCFWSSSEVTGWVAACWTNWLSWWMPNRNITTHFEHSKANLQADRNLRSMVGSLRGMIGSLREVALPFYSAVVRMCLQYWAQFCCHQVKKHTGKPGRVK